MSASVRGIVGALPQEVIAEFAAARTRAAAAARREPQSLAGLRAPCGASNGRRRNRKSAGLRWFAMVFSALLHVVLGVLLLVAGVRAAAAARRSARATPWCRPNSSAKGRPKRPAAVRRRARRPCRRLRPPAPAAPSAAQQPDAADAAHRNPRSPRGRTGTGGTRRRRTRSAAAAAGRTAARTRAAGRSPARAAAARSDPGAASPIRPSCCRRRSRAKCVVPDRQITVPEVRQPTERISRVERPTRPVVEVERVAPQVTRVAPTLRAQEQVAVADDARLATVGRRRRAKCSVPAVRAQIRDIPMPSRGTTPSAQPGTSTSHAAAAPRRAGRRRRTHPPGGQQPAPGSGTAPAAQPGAGTTPGAPPGAWPSPQRGDDWGVGTRNRPGGAPGSTAPGTSGAKPGVFDRRWHPECRRAGTDAGTERARHRRSAHRRPRPRRPAGSSARRTTTRRPRSTSTGVRTKRCCRNGCGAASRRSGSRSPAPARASSCAVSLLALGGALRTHRSERQRAAGQCAAAAGHPVQALVAGRQRQHPQARRLLRERRRRRLGRTTARPPVRDAKRKRPASLRAVRVIRGPRSLTAACPGRGRRSGSASRRSTHRGPRSAGRSGPWPGCPSARVRDRPCDRRAARA